MFQVKEKEKCILSLSVINTHTNISSNILAKKKIEQINLYIAG